MYCFIVWFLHVLCPCAKTQYIANIAQMQRSQKLSWAFNEWIGSYEYQECATYDPVPRSCSISSFSFLAGNHPCQWATPWQHFDLTIMEANNQPNDNDMIHRWTTILMTMMRSSVMKKMLFLVLEGQGERQTGSSNTMSYCRHKLSINNI